MDCRIALQEGASVGDALATAAARLAAELAERSTVGGFSAPWPVAQAVIALLDASVRERAGVTLDELRPVARAPLCRAPALFLRATGDALLGAQLCGNQSVRRMHPKILH